MKDLNEEQKAALIALLGEYEKCLQVIAPIPLRDGTVMECDWRRWEEVPRVLPTNETVRGAMNALDGEAHEELFSRTERMERECGELRNNFTRGKWELENPIKAVKEGNLAEPSLVLRRFRLHLEDNIAFLIGLLEGEKCGEPKKKVKKEKLSFPKNDDALEVLKEAKRRKTGSLKYAGKGNRDIIRSLITDGMPVYRYIIMEGRRDIPEEKRAEYARRDDWGKELMRSEVQKAVNKWASYLGNYLKEELECHKE